MECISDGVQRDAVSFDGMTHTSRQTSRRTSDNRRRLLNKKNVMESALHLRQLATDWHELIIPQRTMWPSVARVSEQQYWTRGLQPADIPPPLSATLGFTP